MERQGQAGFLEKVLLGEHPGVQEFKEEESHGNNGEHGRPPNSPNGGIHNYVGGNFRLMKAGEQYLGEAKSLHVEAGYPWSDLLELKMSACKRAMKRDRGPEVRAKELRLEQIPDNIVDEGSPERVAWSFAWASLWMLRAIEASNVDINHVSLDEKTKVVKLRMPKSKTDQRALGVTRTMQCCGMTPCKRKCPFDLAVKILDGNPVTGHSARRFGAMMWTREGLSVADISFLGRWKSSAVFRYIEDALAEVPMNKRTSVQDENPETKVQEYRKSSSSKQKRPSHEADGGHPPTQLVKAEGDNPNIPITQAKRETKPLMAVSRVRKEATAHRVGQASWGIKLDQWTTLCGWHFARRNVKVELTRLVPKTARSCAKCEKIWLERDGVKGAREWAHQLSQ